VKKSKEKFGKKKGGIEYGNMPPREVKKLSNLYQRNLQYSKSKPVSNVRVIIPPKTLKYQTSSITHNAYYDAHHILLGHRLKKTVSLEDAVKIVGAIFKLSQERDFADPIGNDFPGFKLGSQTSRRSRMPILLEDFSEKERFLKMLEKDLKIIRKQDKNYASNFKPNVLLAFLVEPGGSLRCHLNKKTSIDCNIIGIYSFGCTVRFSLENAKEDLETSDVEYPKCKFNFKSRDFLSFDGVKIRHGYKKVKKSTFCIDQVPLTFPKFGLSEPCRLSIGAMQFDSLEGLKAFFYHGQNQHVPLYKTLEEKKKKNL
jgi:hypothetical protein